jgi:hypothetical protein
MTIKRRITALVSMIVLGVAMASAQTVYVSRTGKSYHTTPTCWALQRSKTVTPIDKAEAQKRGLKPCKICDKADQPAR